MAAFCADFTALRPSPADVRVVTSDGSTIRAHSSVLAAASPVLERMIVAGGRDWDDADGGRTTFTVRVLGAPSLAVAAFLRFLYSDSSSEEDAQLQLHGPAVLALAHAYGVPRLKRRAEDAVAAAAEGGADAVVDALKLAALCDAPRLRLACARLAAKDLHAVQRSEGWRFAGRHDAALQTELLHLIHDDAQRKGRWEKERASQHVYGQLSDAMALLDRTFFAGDGEEEGPCEDEDGGVRRGLEQLMRHFAACGRTRKPDACPRCRRAFQLLRLHASLCDLARDGHDEPCKVALCSNFKAKMQEEGVGKTWKLLVKKAIRARLMSALASREVPEVVKKSRAKYNSRRPARIR